MARLIAMAGLPGVGKSSIARLLARRFGAIWLRINSMDQAIWASGTAPSDLFDWSYRTAQAIAVARDNLNLTRIVAETQVANTRSRAFLERLGMKAIRELTRFGEPQLLYELPIGPLA